jgi:hypothetical protein
MKRRVPERLEGDRPRPHLVTYAKGKLGKYRLPRANKGADQLPISNVLFFRQTCKGPGGSVGGSSPCTTMSETAKRPSGGQDPVRFAKDLAFVRR